MFSCILPQIICKKQRNLEVLRQAGYIHLRVSQKETAPGNCPKILPMSQSLLTFSLHLAPAVARDHSVLIFVLILCLTPKMMCHSPRGTQGSSTGGRPVTNLYEIPALVEAALDLLAIKELREAAFHIIHQAAGIG